ncbi:HD domain-containing protein [Thermodesulforhabdus norvegica]|uniref:HD domain-containing protein n=1 Tax=Thermodesulforhabdus norvegica TaxID=39841 RepID=A0A1I4VFT4_9BACT|nr:HD domain-containing protein [Thermodesulforhabdus norvegica]SFM99986.1 HD domain-containing protein [Thermodesulforhabdus norvegica]
MTREEALELLTRHVKSDNLRKHCLATEAIMRKLAERFGGDPDLWGIAGLLHDLDFEYTKDKPEEHAKKAVDILKDTDLPEEVLQAILRHNAEMLGLTRETTLDYALTAAETITGLIVAAALVHPDKSLASLQAKSVRKRMKSKDFARNVSRENIMMCEKLGMELMEFIELSLEAMRSIRADLGL